MSCWATCTLILCGLHALITVWGELHIVPYVLEQYECCKISIGKIFLSLAHTALLFCHCLYKEVHDTITFFCNLKWATLICSIHPVSSDYQHTTQGSARDQRWALGRAKGWHIDLQASLSSSQNCCRWRLEPWTRVWAEHSWLQTGCRWLCLHCWQNRYATYCVSVLVGCSAV